MGHLLGELPIRIRRIVYYTLSAENQRFWAKFMSHTLPGMFRRSLYSSVVMAPGFLMTFITIKWGTAEHKRSKRKNPALYEKNTK